MLTQLVRLCGKAAQPCCGHVNTDDLQPQSDGHNVIAWHACSACGHTYMTIGEALTPVNRGALR